MLHKYKPLLFLALMGISVITLLIGGVLLLTTNHVPSAHAQPGAPGTLPGPATKFVIFGTGVIGDGLAPQWTNGSLYNGVNTWNIIDTEQVYAGTRSLSWTASAPFERGWVVSPTPLDVSQYQFLNFYARSTQAGQRYEVGFVDATGGMIGTWAMVDSGGGPIQPDRWQLYSFPMTTFALPGATVGGLGFRDANGAPSPKVFFDEIELSTTQGTAPVISQGLGQPGIPSEPPKPKGPYYPQISPWVFIIPAIIIMIAIFFE
jgi:hypothetical protein